MIQRNCAGGIVFFQDRILLLRNDKNEWVLPKGLVKPGGLSSMVAEARVNAEAGVSKVTVLGVVGETKYEFYSMTRKAPVCNCITWYAMESADDHCSPDVSQGFTSARFFPWEEAIRTVTYSQDKAIIAKAQENYFQFLKIKG